MCAKHKVIATGAYLTGIVQNSETQLVNIFISELWSIIEAIIISPLTMCICFQSFCVKEV